MHKVPGAHQEWFLNIEPRLNPEYLRWPQSKTSTKDNYRKKKKKPVISGYSRKEIKREVSINILNYCPERSVLEIAAYHIYLEIWRKINTRRHEGRKESLKGKWVAPQNWTQWNHPHPSCNVMFQPMLIPHLHCLPLPSSCHFLLPTHHNHDMRSHNAFRQARFTTALFCSERWHSCSQGKSPQAR